MRIFAAILFLAVLVLQYRLWISDDGVREVRRLQSAVVAQERENAALTARNAQLAAEVENLKKGLDAVEERARSDLGMVGANETFYQVVTPAPALPELTASAPESEDADDSGPPGSAAQATKPRRSHQASAR